MDESEKKILLYNYQDLEFQSSISAYKCCRCHKVAMSPHFSSCNHVFCRKCKNFILNRYEFKCPSCSQLISAMGSYEKAFARKVAELWCFCPNKKLGCQHRSTLKQMASHIRVCPYAKSSKNQAPVPTQQRPLQKFNSLADLNLLKATEKFGKINISGTQLKNKNFNAVPGKYYNVLLLGQTGVGKSTFINAFANYLRFQTLEDAAAGKPECLIPCQYTISDDKFMEHVIKFGEDRNENVEGKGQSATQSCREYIFPIYNFKLRLIDSPGIGDTRGIDQDKTNLDNIIQFISKYEDLYAICVMLKPNEARLTTLFGYCIKELFSHLHENAKNNMVFLFTNSRNTFYRPGETTVPLKQILADLKTKPPHPDVPFARDNIFCLDNEAFRFLIALKNKIPFSAEDQHNFSESWTRSVAEIERMIKYVVEDMEARGVTPHLTKDTVTVSYAREAIASLSQPLSEIAKNIQRNLQLLERKAEEIKSCQKEKRALEGRLYIPQASLKVIEVDHPRTVCSSDTCKQVISSGAFYNVHYPKKCHQRCYLNNVPKDTVGLERLRHCSAMSPETEMCTICGCHFAQHLHIYYESETVTTQISDPNIKSQLHTQRGTIRAAKWFLKKVDARMAKYKEEEEFLTGAMASLAIYLKTNAMVVCNDTFEEYLNEMIKNEKFLYNSGLDNQSVVEGLEDMLAKYKVQQDILGKVPEGAQVSESKINSDQVQEIIHKLSNLPLTGDAFKNMLNAYNKFQ